MSVMLSRGCMYKYSKYCEILLQFKINLIYLKIKFALLQSHDPSEIIVIC